MKPQGYSRLAILIPLIVFLLFPVIVIAATPTPQPTTPRLTSPAPAPTSQPTTLAPARPVKVPPPVMVHIQTQADVDATRSELETYLFGSASLPTLLPEKGKGPVVFNVTMQNGLISRIHMHSPVDADWNGSVIIYHHGHQGDVNNDVSTIGAFVTAGYRVFELDMPFYGVNTFPLTVHLPDWGNVTIHAGDHETMRVLAPVTTGSPLRYFLDPVIALVNMLSTQDKVKHIYMTGISGGGWTTVLVAALDTRIEASYPVAHSLPMAYRFLNKDAWGDYEQTDLGLLTIADYQDLYVMGAANRRQLSIYNEHDNCCWYGNTAVHSAYAPAVQAAAQKLNGQWSLWVDPMQVDHGYGPGAIKHILDDIALQEADAG